MTSSTVLELSCDLGKISVDLKAIWSKTWVEGSYLGRDRGQKHFCLDFYKKDDL